MDIEKVQEYLKERLSEKRYKHSLGVAEEAVKLSEKYGADKEKAYFCGLIHDCAKEIENSEAKRLLTEKYGVCVDEVTFNTHKLLHGPLGACIAQYEFGVYDMQILDAIKYHTTAKADMPVLTKILYIADYIEPNRTFDGVDELRRLAYEDMDKAIYTGLDWTIEELMEKRSLIHPDTVRARNFLLLDMMK